MWGLCLVHYHTCTLKLPIQILLSVALELQVFAFSGNKYEKFGKTSTSLWSPEHAITGRLVTVILIDY